MLTCLHKNSLEKQKFPALNMIRQICKCNHLKVYPFVICKGFDACLFLYPVEEWKIVEEQLSSLSSIKGTNRNFIRNIVRHANYVKYDSQGRIGMPEILLNYSKIKKF